MAKKEKQEPAEKPIISYSGEVDEFGRFIEPEDNRRPQGFNASDPKQIEAAKREQGQYRRHDRDFFRICMSTPDRRASFYRLLERCHIYSTPSDTTNTNQTFFNLGQENVGKQLMLAAMDASTDLYLTMLKEQKEQRDAKERKNDE